MEEIKEEFQNNIYEYCDENIGKKILFKGFTFLESRLDRKNKDITPKNLAILTSNIINELITKRILKEVNLPDNFATGYPMYEILPHKKLI